jgi:hypothetical protein
VQTVQHDAEGRETTVLRVKTRYRAKPLLYPFYFDDFRRDVRLLVRFRGTLAPFFRASERPIAIACFRLVTLPALPPLPLRSVPFFRRRIALSTRLLADFPYFRELDRFVAAIGLLLCSTRKFVLRAGAFQDAFQLAV